MKLEDMTWCEVLNYLEKNDTLIIPVGTCEQHGHHLPLNTDILVCEYFADYLSKEAGLLVAPVLNYGVNLICDKYYCGTANISENTLITMIREIIDWWNEQGFKKYILLSYHGEPLHIKALHNISKNCHALELYDIDYSGILEQQEMVKHACEAETSLMMYLFPDKVREEEIIDCDIDDEKFNEYVRGGVSFDRNVFPGCVGFPSKATLEKGKEIEGRTRTRIIDWFNRHAAV